MKDFAAIDFETANNQPTSVCSVGVVIVKNNEFVDSFYSLIQPEPFSVIRFPFYSATDKNPSFS